jgi:2-polyprenyl-3-methyl-5-hydroxy-6-metoxy-1,4-benzoquinol methylase
MPEITACPICGSTQLYELLRTRDYHYTQEEFPLKRCEQCSFIMTSPRPDIDDLPRYYSSPEYLSHTEKSNTLIARAYRFVRHFTIRNKEKLVRNYQVPATLLDFGCGTGDFLGHAQDTGWQVFGVEPSHTARQVAATRMANIFATIDPVPLHSCNAITLWHVLEHVPDLRKTLDQLTQRLTPDGTIFIAVPNIESADSRHYGITWAGLDVPRHLWHFNRKTMERLLQQHGLKLLRTIPMKLDAYYVSLLSEKYRNKNSAGIGTYVRAMRIGAASNRAARKSGEYSSLIYVATR